MRGKVKKEGNYELFKTTKGHEILTLNQNEWYALVSGAKGDLIVHSDSDHEKEKILQQGRFFLADFEDDPEFNDMPHLFLAKGSGYTELILPNGLPTKSDHQKKLVRTKERLPKSKIREHVKGKGASGSEKQYQDQPEGLRTKTRDELYEKARKEGIRGRSKMKKEELVQRLKN